MKLIKAKDYKDMSRKAANIISAQIILKPNSVIAFPSGSTPVGAYEQLVEWYQKGDLDFSGVRALSLDEYRGLSGEDEHSYRYFMNTTLYNKVNIKMEHTYIPNGLADDVAAECARYDALIEQLGGIDLIMLGLGYNGHIGFNEPNVAFEKTTHCVELVEGTLRANARFFDSIDDVPRQAITLGIKSIMQAKKIILIVNGENKSYVLSQALFGPVTPQVPASILQLHPDVTVVEHGAM